MSNFITTSQHFKTFPGIDLRTTAATYGAIGANASNIVKTLPLNHSLHRKNRQVHQVAAQAFVLCIGIGIWNRWVPIY